MNLKKVIIPILYFILAIAIFWSIPKTQKFRYEFQKGKPWNHPSLFAPFDFPVYVSDETYKAKTDSIRRSFKPYLHYNENRNKEIINVLRNVESIELDTLNDITQKQIVRDVAMHLINAIDSVYSLGVLSDNDFKKLKTRKTKQVYLLYDKYTILQPFDTLSSVTSVRRLISDIEMQMLQKYPKQNEVIRQLSTLFHSKKNIRANIVYDVSFNKQMLKDALSGVIKTNGMIQRGERIISYGELVSDKKYDAIESLKQEYQTNDSVKKNRFLTIGYAILIFIVLLMIYIFINNHFTDISSVTPHLLSLLLISVFFFAAIILVRTQLINLYLVPFIVLPIVIRVFYDEDMALFVFLFFIFLVSIVVADRFDFVLLNTLAGLSTIFSLRSISTRSDFIKAALYAFLTYALVYSALNFIYGKTLSELRYTQYLWFLLNTFLILLSYGFIFIVEKVFGLLSEISLMELSNTNRPLLRQLAEKAPGSFQHSLQVANLAAETASKIKANSLLLRTGALYHDIGKIVNPEYFTENQQGGYSPHNNLSPAESAKIIIGHIANGVKLAKQHRLPNAIIDFITMHHGTTKTRYFYYKAQQENTEVNESLFTYPGPKPFSRETAILMMADSVEAASRSLETYSVESINDLVDSIIDHQFHDGQFNESNLTLQDIQIIKDVFKIKLGNIYHARIAYPKGATE